MSNCCKINKDNNNNSTASTNSNLFIQPNTSEYQARIVGYTSSSSTTNSGSTSNNQSLGGRTRIKLF